MKLRLIWIKPMVACDPFILLMPAMVAFANIWLAALLLVLFCAPVPTRTWK